MRRIKMFLALAFALACTAFAAPVAAAEVKAPECNAAMTTCSVYQPMAEDVCDAVRATTTADAPCVETIIMEAPVHRNPTTGAVYQSTFAPDEEVDVPQASGVEPPGTSINVANEETAPTAVSAAAGHCYKKNGECYYRHIRSGLNLAPCGYHWYTVKPLTMTRQDHSGQVFRVKSSWWSEGTVCEYIRFQDTQCNSQGFGSSIDNTECGGIGSFGWWQKSSRTMYKVYFAIKGFPIWNELTMKALKDHKGNVWLYYGQNNMI